MSDYEVTLVNDNSTCCFLSTLHAATNNNHSVRSASSRSSRYAARILTHTRQEFFVRFKGPEESALYWFEHVYN